MARREGKKHPQRNTRAAVTLAGGEMNGLEDQYLSLCSLQGPALTPLAGQDPNDRSGSHLTTNKALD